MADTEHKIKQLAGLDPVYPAIGGLAANTVMRWAPLRAAMAAQDAIPATSRRILAEYGLDGSDDWHVPAGTVDPDAFAQLYPLNDVWRITTTQLAGVAPSPVPPLPEPSGSSTPVVSVAPSGDVSSGLGWQAVAQPIVEGRGPHASPRYPEGILQFLMLGVRRDRAAVLSIDRRVISLYGELTNSLQQRSRIIQRLLFQREPVASHVGIRFVLVRLLQRTLELHDVHGSNRIVRRRIHPPTKRNLILRLGQRRLLRKHVLQRVVVHC